MLTQICVTIWQTRTQWFNFSHIERSFFYQRHTRGVGWGWGWGGGGGVGVGWGGGGSISRCYQCRDFYCKDKTVSWLSYFYNRNRHTLKDGLYIEMGSSFVKVPPYSKVKLVGMFLVFMVFILNTILPSGIKPFIIWPKSWKLLCQICMIATIVLLVAYLCSGFMSTWHFWSK